MTPETQPQGAPSGPQDGQQKLANQFDINTTDQIFGHATDSIMETMESTPELAMAIGQTAAEIMKSQLDAMQAVGKQLDQDYFLSAGEKIVTELVQLAETMGLVSEDVQQLTAEAMMNASQVFATMAPEYIDAERLNAFLTDAANGKFDGAGDGQNQ